VNIVLNRGALHIVSAMDRNSSSTGVGVLEVANLVTGRGAHALPLCFRQEASRLILRRSGTHVACLDLGVKL
jgi:hypothetical protein